MSTNEEAKVEALEDDVEEEDELGDEPEDKDTTDWKAEARKARGIATRARNQLKKLKEAQKAAPPPANPEKKVEKKEGFDYAEKAFLKASNIQTDEYDFVREVMQATGKSLDDVLESKYFQAELKERREAKASKEAIPSGSKRSAPATRDTVEYWLAKGELPPADQQELRQKVVNARIEKEKNKSQFSDRPIV